MSNEIVKAGILFPGERPLELRIKADEMLITGGMDPLKVPLYIDNALMTGQIKRIAEHFGAKNYFSWQDPKTGELVIKFEYKDED